MVENKKNTRKLYPFFKFDNGDLKNIKIIDKQNIHNNFQVINQVEVERTSKNRYDVTILVNGLPLVHIELKKEVKIYNKLLTKFTDIVKKVST